MRRIWMALGMVGLLGGVASAHDFQGMGVTPESNVHVVRQQRGFFNAVRMNRDLPRQACNGAEPIEVRTFHTTGDGVAAVLTGILYTPAHLRVVCPTPTAQR